MSVMSIGAAIKHARERASIGQTEFASLLGVHRTTVFRVETGKQEVTWDYVRDASRVLGLSVEQIQRGDLVERWRVLPAKTRSKLRKRFGTDVTELERFIREEHAEYGVPSDEFITALAAECGITVDALLYGNDLVLSS